MILSFSVGDTSIPAARDGEHRPWVEHRVEIWVEKWGMIEG
jgi:hypothetical protein